MVKGEKLEAKSERERRNRKRREIKKTEKAVRKNRERESRRESRSKEQAETFHNAFILSFNGVLFWLYTLMVKNIFFQQAKEKRGCARFLWNMIDVKVKFHEKRCSCRFSFGIV